MPCYYNIIILNAEMLLSIPEHLSSIHIHVFIVIVVIIIVVVVVVVIVIIVIVDQDSLDHQQDRVEEGYQQR